MNLIMTTVGDASVTHGVMKASPCPNSPNGAVFYTVEQSWRDNVQGKSCVPAGLYSLIPYLSPKHGSTWCLHNPDLNVFGQGGEYYPLTLPEGARTYIEIHSGNYAEQLEGCIALGLFGHPMYDPITGIVEAAVQESRDAVEALTGILGPMTSGHTLNIVRSQPT